ncbi:MAG: trigger factor [Angustibacter sp.]
MKSAVETLNPTRVKLTVEVPLDELKPSLDAAYKTIGAQIQVPGFRRGKVPARIIDQRVGQHVVLEEAMQSAVPEFYGQAVTEAKIFPLGRPEWDIIEPPDLATGADLTFTVEVDIRPTIELPDTSGVSLTVDDAEVSDEDVTAGLTALQQRFGSLITVERPAQDGDFVSLDLAAEIDGQEIDAVKGISFEIGSKDLLDGLDEALIGLSAGDSSAFTAPLAGGEQAGVDAQCTVQVHAVKERELPELNDTFAEESSEFDTIEELTADVRSKLAHSKMLAQSEQAHQRLLETLLELSEIPLPEGVVTAEVEAQLERAEKSDDAEYRAEVEAEVRTGLQQQFLLDALAEQQKVSVSQAELIDYLVRASQQYGMAPDAFAKAVEESNQIQSMVAEVARRKGLTALLEQVSVQTTSGAVVDFAELRAESTGEQPAADAGQESEKPDSDQSAVR